MTEKRKPGRPKKIIIDYSEVEKLAKIQCTLDEIASHVNISVRSLRRDKVFCQIYQKAAEEGKKSLRRLQFEKARGKPAVLATDETGKILKDDKGKPFVLERGYAPDTVMQIWLGKQYLGQTDKQELKQGGEVEFVVKYRKVAKLKDGNGKVRPQDIDDSVSSEAKS